MKSIYLLLFLTVLISFTVAHAQVVCDGVDKPESTRVYFINGILTQPSGMNASRDALRTALGNLTDNVYRFSINSNTSVKDLYEVARQALGTKNVANFWKWMNDPFSNSNPTEFKEAYASHYYSLANVEYASNADLRRMVDQYLSDLRAGKKVVLVSHSQGNFFSNSALGYILSRFPEYTSNIGIVAVGTPAAFVGGDGLSIQNSEDVIIFTLVNKVLQFDVVKPNISISGYESTNHAFLDTYMEGASAQIVSAVQTTINNLSQTKIDADCDNRIAEITVLNATQVTSTSAILQGRLTQGTNVDAWFVYGEDGTNLHCDPMLHDGIGTYSAETIVTSLISSLKSNTTYYARACAQGLVGGVRDGGLITFITERENTPAVITTITAREVLPSKATLVGELSEGRDAIIWVSYAPGNTVAVCSLSSYQEFINRGSTQRSAIYRSEITAINLTPGTKYSYRFCAYNGLGDISNASGGVKQFITPSLVL